MKEDRMSFEKTFRANRSMHQLIEAKIGDSNERGGMEKSIRTRKEKSYRLSPGSA
jgi:hypothetical protein